MKELGAIKSLIHILHKAGEAGYDAKHQKNNN